MTKREWSGLLEDAIQVALDNHRGETDRDGEVFIRHPLRVMEKVPDAARVVAVLHDVLEDGGTIDPVRTRLTAEELQALEVLTRNGPEPYGTYIERIANSGNRIALWVKRADPDRQPAALPELPGTPPAAVREGTRAPRPGPRGLGRRREAAACLSTRRAGACHRGPRRTPCCTPGGTRPWRT